MDKNSKDHKLAGILKILLILIKLLNWIIMTKEIDVQDIINMNYRILTLLGMVTSLLVDCKNSRPRSEHYKFDWFLDSLNAVVYENKSILPLPEREY